MRFICLLLLFGCVYSNESGNKCSSNPYISDAGPLIRTSAGSLVGKYVKVFDTEVAAFLGIPFAEPPINEKRFSKSSPLDHWAGVLNATVKPSPCMQYSSRNFSWIPTSTPSEDCLYLNVWTPSKCCCSLVDRLPVLVWIYGGGFYSGSSDMSVYDGSTIAAHNKAIVVSINYRVGIFGFLNTGTEEAPGNAGLWDQTLALKWIKNNIENFGGDPNSITIVGQSAGSWSVSLHTISPMSRNLFNAAILESGSAYHPQIVDSAEAAQKKAAIYAQLLGCGTGALKSIVNDHGVMDCIKSKSSWELAKAEDTMTSKFPQYFLPSYGDDILPISPIKAFNEGQIAPVNILTGNTENEATIFLNYLAPTIFRLDSEPPLNLDAAKGIIASIFEAVPLPPSDEIFEYYFQNASTAESNEIVKIIADAFGDFVFNCPTQFFAEKAKNVYFYWMTHRSSKEKMAKWLGVPHFYEVPYVFGVPLHDASTYTPEDSKFSVDLIKKWTTFAAKGHPLGDKSSDDWPEFTLEKPLAYELNPKEESILTYPRAEACEFWRPFLSPAVC